MSLRIEYAKLTGSAGDTTTSSHMREVMLKEVAPELPAAPLLETQPARSSSAVSSNRTQALETLPEVPLSGTSLVELRPRRCVLTSSWAIAHSALPLPNRGGLTSTQKLQSSSEHKCTREKPLRAAPPPRSPINKQGSAYIHIARSVSTLRAHPSSPPTPTVLALLKRPHHTHHSSCSHDSMYLRGLILIEPRA